MRQASNSCCRSRAGSATAVRRISTAACSRPSPGPRVCSRTRSASHVFATVHTAFIHPVVAAKQLATADQLGRGRLGLNVVAGWNKPEYDAFGVDLPQAHSDRYALAQEWFDVVKQAVAARWAVRLERHVLQAERRLRISASLRWHAADHERRGLAGRAAVRHAQRGLPVLHLAWTRRNRSRKSSTFASKRAEHGRNTGVFTLCHVVCRPTKKEAEDYLHYYADEKADWAAVDNLMRLQGMHAQSFPAEALQMLRGRFAAGHGTLPLVGDPDTVATRARESVRRWLRGLHALLRRLCEGVSVLPGRGVAAAGEDGAAQRRAEPPLSSTTALSPHCFSSHRFILLCMAPNGSRPSSSITRWNSRRSKRSPSCFVATARICSNCIAPSG